MCSVMSITMHHVFDLMTKTRRKRYSFQRRGAIKTLFCSKKIPFRELYACRHSGTFALRAFSALLTLLSVVDKTRNRLKCLWEVQVFGTFGTQRRIRRTYF
jgi:hypothetical protein